jgi:hypothetical protein
MRAVVAWLVAAVSVLALLAPGAAAPPDDVATHCRTTYPQLQLQVRCLNIEYAAAERVSRSLGGIESEMFDRCHAASNSWTVMEVCLAQSLVAGAPAGAAGVVPSNVPSRDSSARPAAAGGAPVATAAPLPALPAPFTLPGAQDPAAPTTAALDPQLVPPIEPERPTVPISEADAERHLRSVLERVGYRSAQCTKKQYGPGWVSVCQ